VLLNKLQLIVQSRRRISVSPIIRLQFVNMNLSVRLSPHKKERFLRLGDTTTLFRKVLNRADLNVCHSVDRISTITILN
jgi:hypothetical protein